MVFYASFLQKLYCMLNFLQQLYCMPHFFKMVLHVSFLKVGFACLIFYGVVTLTFLYADVNGNQIFKERLSLDKPTNLCWLVPCSFLNGLSELTNLQRLVNCKLFNLK